MLVFLLNPNGICSWGGMGDRIQEKGKASEKYSITIGGKTNIAVSQKSKVVQNYWKTEFRWE